jgi:hypothetical protein
MRVAGPIALIIGSTLSIFVFAFHPAHASMSPAIGPFSLSQVVHGAALVGAPLIAFGMWRMAVWLGAERASVQLALLFALFAVVMTMAAAVVSDFVTPIAAKATMATMLHGSVALHDFSAKPPTLEQMPPLIQSVVAMNRGFAQVHVFYLSLAILLFACAMRRHRVFSTAGAIVGIGPILWQLSGKYSPEITTMPWIAIPQSLWLIGVAWGMLRKSADFDVSAPGHRAEAGSGGRNRPAENPLNE